MGRIVVVVFAVQFVRERFEGGINLAIFVFLLVILDQIDCVAKQKGGKLFDNPL